jgi:hypothetical protein
MEPAPGTVHGGGAPGASFHWAVAAGNHERIAAESTAAFVGDAEGWPALLERLPADDAHDTRTCHPILDRPAALMPRRRWRGPSVDE